MDNPIADAIERDLAAVRGLFEPHHTSAEHPAAAVTIGTTPREEPVSLLTEGKKLISDGLAKFENVDEKLAATMENISASPGAMQVVTMAEQLLHLPPSAWTMAANFLSDLGQVFPPPASPVAPAEPSFTPAGPVTGGQA